MGRLMIFFLLQTHENFRISITIYNIENHVIFLNPYENSTCVKCILFIFSSCENFVFADGFFFFQHYWVTFDTITKINRFKNAHNLDKLCFRTHFFNKIVFTIFYI